VGAGDQRGFEFGDEAASSHHAKGAATLLKRWIECRENGEQRLATNAKGVGCPKPAAGRPAIVYGRLQEQNPSVLAKFLRKGPNQRLDWIPHLCGAGSGGRTTHPPLATISLTHWICEANISPESSKAASVEDDKC
jgi:hypothetical protein